VHMFSLLIRVHLGQKIQIYILAGYPGDFHADSRAATTAPLCPGADAPDSD